MMRKLIQGRYLLYKQLGRGGFGETFLAQDQIDPDNSPCVVKKILLSSNKPEVLEQARMRFEREAEALKKLGTHPQIPQLYDYFEIDKEFYLVQEYIQGNPLIEEIKEGEAWSESEVITLLKEILKILQFVHQEEIIHRDVNPNNLIRRKSDRKLVLIDFGAVKVNLGAAPRNIKSTITVGTPGYIPNEQAGGSPKLCSDIYAVGMIGIQALTGIPVTQLEEDPDTSEILWKQRVKISQSLETVLEKMVRSYFLKRYQSATEALTALNNVPIIKPEKLPSKPKKVSLPLPPKLPELIPNPPQIIEKIPISPVRKIPHINKETPIKSTENPSKLIQEPLLPSRKASPEIISSLPDIRLLGRYEIIKTLQSGNCNESYLAKDDHTNLCIIKKFQKHNIENSALPSVTEKFNSQAQILYELGKNDRLPSLLNHFVIDSDFYLVSKFIQGNQLNKELEVGQALSTGKVYELIREILEVLILLHDKNIIHGNLSCQQLLRRETDQKIVLLDLGNIKQINGITNPDQLNLWEMTISGYIAPEQKQGNIQLSSDIYAVGMIGIQALTGLTPRLIQQQINQEKAKFNWRNVWQEKCPEIIPEIADVLDKMISSDWQKRYNSAKEALRAWKKLSDGWLGIGNSLCFKKKFAEAIASYEEILKKMPEFYRAWHQKGKALAMWGKYQEATESFENALKLNPKYYNSLYEIGNVLMKRKEYESAITKYEKSLEVALENKIDFAEAWYAKGIAFFALARYEEAIAAYETALHIKPEYYEAKCGIGDIHVKLQQLEVALKIYEEAITIKKGCCYEAWYGKAQILETQSNYQAALQAYQKTTEIKDRHYEAWYGRGKMLEKLANYEAAICAYKKAIQIQPNFTLAIARLESLENRKTRKWLRYFNKFPNPLRKNDSEL